MALGFAAWGLVSAFAPTFRAQFQLSAQATAFLIAVPVLLGSLARLPIGMLTDRFGGRVVFSALFAFVAVAAALVPGADTFARLLVYAFLLGLAGASFAVGVASRRAGSRPRSRGPRSGSMAWATWDIPPPCSWGPWSRNPTGATPSSTRSPCCRRSGPHVFSWSRATRRSRCGPASMAAMVAVLTRERLAWALAAFYFLTFGGFVAFSVYLPTLLRDEFG
jgi:NNP family nitrate/nitrite transporter-like MFS transporter